MIWLDEIMTKNKLGLKDTFHKSSFVKSFNKSFKKDYKLYPFIIERYLSCTLMYRDKIIPKLFYWNDNRKILDQVEHKGDILECFKGPITRGKLHESQKTIFENKRISIKKYGLMRILKNWTNFVREQEKG